MTTSKLFEIRDEERNERFEARQEIAAGEREFFVVWNPATTNFSPVIRYATYNEAEQVAKAAASFIRGDQFFILRTVAVAKVDPAPPVVTMLEADR